MAAYYIQSKEQSYNISEKGLSLLTEKSSFVVATKNDYFAAYCDFDILFGHGFLG